MAPLQVFVSYSHKDKRALERLQTHLAPLRRQLAIDLWDDTRLRAGDAWLPEIERALESAGAAILLVSADFLASEFIVGREVPPLLRRAAGNGLTLLPIFWAPSDVENVDFVLPDGQGTRQLSDFQGFGTPKRTLLKRPYGEREEEFQRLAARLRELAGSPAPASAAASRPVTIPTPSFHPTTEPVREFELTVEIQRSGDALELLYLRPKREPLGRARRSWGDFERPPTDPSIGTFLFRHLFGEAAEWGPLLRALFGTRPEEVQPNPSRHPVRLRIATDEPLLLSLPWRTLTWNRRVLVRDGWTVETTTVPEPTRDVATAAPCAVLVADSTGAFDAATPQAVLEVLRSVWGSFREVDHFRRVAGPRELEAGLAGVRPHLLYLHGPTPGPLADLPAMFARAGHTPPVVVVAPAGLGPEERPSPPEILGAEVPLLVWRRRPGEGDDGPRFLLTWLRRWLESGEDPVAALHAVAADEGFRSSPEAANVAIHANYRSWSTARPTVRTVGGSPLLKLDRREQKALVVRETQTLVRNDAARALALVAYAAPGNAIASLGKQLRHDLELEAEREAAIRWYAPKFPLQREALEEYLEGELRLHLSSGPDEPAGFLLRRCAPRVVLAGRRPALWLDWGTFGETDGKASDRLQPPLTKAHLRDWLAFTASFLARLCPPDVRVVSFLALELPEARHAKLVRTLHDCESEPRCQSPELSLTILPPLGSVTESDLRKYLSDPLHGCPREIQGEIARLVAKETGGTFDTTYRLLEQGESSSWLALLHRLRGEARSPSPDDDEIL